MDKDFRERMDKYRIPIVGVGLIEACSDNVVLFAEHMLGFKLYSWQVYYLRRIQEEINGKYELLLNSTREFGALTSRQIGKSTALSILALWACVFNKVKGSMYNNTTVGIISATDQQAKKLLDDIRRLLRAGDAYMKMKYVDPDGKPLFGKAFFTDMLSTVDSNNMSTISFKAYNDKVHGQFLLKDSIAGSKIKSFPPTSIVLGETFSIIMVDEAGKSDKVSDQFFYDIVTPTGNASNAIRIYTSTPWSPSGFFYRFCDPFSEYLEHPVDIVVFTIEAIKEENPTNYETAIRMITQMNSDGKTDEVQRAYYCRFVKGEHSYFSPKKVFDIFRSDYTMTDSYQGLCDMGIDFGGQVKSKTVITISRLDEDGNIVRLYHQSYEVGKDLSLINDVSELLKRFNVQRIIPDDCPAGDFLIRLMKEKGWNIHPMNFRSEKVKKFGAFRKMLNEGRVISYEDADFRTELLALENSQTSRQSVICAPKGYNDDLVDSMVLSSYFFLNEDSGLKVWDVDDYL